MSGAITLVVLVASGEARDPTTQSMARATRDALGDATVEVRETRTTPSDEEALAVEKSARPDAVVELRWSDAAHRKAIVRLHLIDGSRWVERTITFKPTDAFAERGRTLGFAVASILPEAAAAPSGSTSTSTPTPTPTPTSTSTPTPTPTPTSTPTPSPASARTSASASAPALAPSAAPASASSPAFALDLVPLLSLGLDTPLLFTGGGALAFHWFPFPALSLRVEGDLRGGTVDSATAVNVLLSSGAVGMQWHVLPCDSSRQVGFSVRADAVLAVRKITRQSSANVTEEKDPDDPSAGLDAFAEGCLRVVPSVEAIAGIGGEALFSKTYPILVGTSQVGILPPAHLTLEAGARIRF